MDVWSEDGSRGLNVRRDGVSEVPFSRDVDGAGAGAGMLA